MFRRFGSKIYFSFRAAVILLFISLVLQHAHAADALPSLKELLDLPLQDLLDVRVSVASRFSESLLETGSTTSLIDRAQWQSLGARRFKDALDMQPGIIVLPNAFASEPVYIRGFAERYNTNGVATLLDGVSLNLLEGSAQFTRQNVNLGTLDRIEVIRGPGSSLYGDGAFHGVLDLHSFESKNNVALFDIDYAGNGFSDSAINYSHGFGHNRVNFALANSGQTAQHLRYEYIDSSNNIANSERNFIFNTTTLIFKWNFQQSQHIHWYANLYWDDNRYDSFYGLGTTKDVLGATVAADDTGGVDSKFAMLQLGSNVQLSGKRIVELRLYTNKSTREFRQKVAHNNGSTFIGIGDLYGDGRNGEINTGQNITLKQERIGNFRWSMDISHKLSRMGDYYNTQIDNAGNYWTSPAGAGSITFNRARLAFSGFRRHTSGLGVDSTGYLANDKLLLKLGGRYDHYSDFGSVFSPRLGAILRHNDGQSYNLHYGRAYRAPSSGEIKGFSNSGENPNLGAETIDTFELAFNKQSTHFLQEYTLFKSFWRNAITYVFQFGSSYYDNSGLSSAYGGEASWTYQKKDWRWHANTSYVRSRNNQMLTNYVAFPKWIINASVSHLDPASKTRWKISNRIHLGAVEGQYEADAMPYPRQLKDYWRADFHVSRPWNKQASMSFDIRNLFDRKNFLPSVQDHPSSFGAPDEERSLKVGMHFVW